MIRDILYVKETLFYLERESLWLKRFLYYIEILYDKERFLYRKKDSFIVGSHHLLFILFLYSITGWWSKKKRMKRKMMGTVIHEHEVIIPRPYFFPFWSLTSLPHSIDRLRLRIRACNGVGREKCSFRKDQKERNTWGVVVRKL